MSLPWLTEPVMLHSSRDPGMCDMTPEQCAYKQRYWVFWYEADHRYALPTVALSVVAVIVFTIFHLFSIFTPTSWRSSRLWKRVVSASRLLSYTSWRVGNWNSQSLGTYLLGAVGFIFFLAMTLGPRPYYWPNTMELSYGNSPPIATRAGYMALGCLPILLILGTKANPVAALTGVSHEKLVVLHGWVAWAMFVLALVHTFPFVVYNMWMGSMADIWVDGMWLTGIIALAAQAWLTVMSIRWIRERYYEFFKATHFFFAMVFVIFFFLHCDYILTSWDYIISAVVLYTLSWLFAQCKTFMEHGFKHRARLSLATDQMVKISIETDADWTPGQHVYLRFLTLGVHSLTAHPFTICSSPVVGKGREMVFYAKPRGGLTSRLARLAAKEPNMAVPVLLDGPYGGVTTRWFRGFDQTLVVGGGAGAGFTLSLAEDFLAATRYGSHSAHMTVAVATRDPGMRGWYLDALRQIAAREPDEDEKVKTPRLSVQIYETDSSGESMAEHSDPESNSSQEKLDKGTSDVQAAVVGVFDVQFFKGRPDLKALTQSAAATRGATVGIVVCGPSSMVHDVGLVAASAQKDILRSRDGAEEVWFHKESFS